MFHSPSEGMSPIMWEKHESGGENFTKNTLIVISLQRPREFVEKIRRTIGLTPEKTKRMYFLGKALNKAKK